jgi:hypothetical protein
MVHAGVMEKIMSKTNAVNAAATSERELTEAELELVLGGKGIETAIKGQVVRTIELTGHVGFYD